MLQCGGGADLRGAWDAGDVLDDNPLGFEGANAVGHHPQLADSLGKRLLFGGGFLVQVREALTRGAPDDPLRIDGEALEILGDAPAEEIAHFHLVDAGFPVVDAVCRAGVGLAVHRGRIREIVPHAGAKPPGAAIEVHKCLIGGFGEGTGGEQVSVQGHGSPPSGFTMMRSWSGEASRVLQASQRRALSVTRWMVKSPHARQ